MKILITGGNKNQCTFNHYLNQQLKVVPSHYSLIRCLEDMGHEVVQKEVFPGEDLSGFDKAFVFLASPNQLVGLTTFSMLWAIDSFAVEDTTILFDDWQTHGIYQGIVKCKADTNAMYRDFVLGQQAGLMKHLETRDTAVVKEFIEPFTEQFISAIDLLEKRAHNVLLSAFAGGDLSLLIDWPKDKLFSYNPNPYHRNRKPGDYGDLPDEEPTALDALFGEEESEVKPEDKHRMFNFVSLVQGKTKKWLDKQQINEWEIEFFGSRKDKQRRLKEGDMCKVYAEQWACLMPGYDHASSGWWRARIIQLADAGSILIGDPKEMMLYYHDEELANLKASDVEKMTLDELTATAVAQREAVLKHHPLDKKVQQEELKAVL